MRAACSWWRMGFSCQSKCIPQPLPPTPCNTSTSSQWSRLFNLKSNNILIEQAALAQIIAPCMLLSQLLLFSNNSVQQTRLKRQDSAKWRTCKLKRRQALSIKVMRSLRSKYSPLSTAHLAIHPPNSSKWRTNPTRSTLKKRNSLSSTPHLAHLSTNLKERIRNRSSLENSKIHRRRR